MERGRMNVSKILQHKNVFRRFWFSQIRFYGAIPLRKEKKKTLPVTFKNVKRVTPQTLESFLFSSMKLIFVDEQKASNQPGVELLRNIAVNYDYWVVRSHQDILLYYRLEMMLQRLNFYRTIGMTPRQKLRHIQKHPPLLVFSFTDNSFNSSMIYLRGLTDVLNCIHVFYPVTRKLMITKTDIVERVKTVEEELEIQQPSALTEIINMPCFFMDPELLKNVPHMFVHKHIMPFYYNIDAQTVNILPPICNLQSLKLSPKDYFSNKASKELISSLPTYKLNDILDYSYSTSNGKGTAECLSTFLIRSEREEYKDRTGGQPLKGRRGFNVPARQY